MSAWLYIALDNLAKKESETLKIAEQLAQVPGNFGFKVNLDYLLKVGISKAADKILTFGRPWFADIKMWNGSRTMSDAIDELVAAQASLLNVYALGDDMIPDAVARTAGSMTKVLGITVLTHYTEAYCQRHFKRSLSETVRHLSETAVSQGCDGIILPGTMLDEVSYLETEKMTPGIRPPWYKDTRHEQEVTPAEAVAKKATYIVCGSPVMKDPKPVAALQRLLEEIPQ